ncbi:MAG: hypothetical protein Q8K75_08165 [Chlamydiales bacterium]|nr:hypothetical protein [Chlamydiales bacterium]
MTSYFGNPVSLSNYTKEDVKSHLAQLENLLKTNDPKLSEKDVAYYTTFLEIFQSTLERVTESEKLCNPKLAETIIKLNHFEDLNEWLTDNGGGASWLTVILPVHELSKTGHRDFPNGKLYGVFESPFSERERVIDWNKYSSWMSLSRASDPLEHYTAKSLEENFNLYLKNVDERSQGNITEQNGKKYYKGLLSAVEKGMAPFKNENVLDYKKLPALLTALARFPQLADQLSKCHAASFIVFEKYSDYVLPQELPIESAPLSPSRSLGGNLVKFKTPVAQSSPRKRNASSASRLRNPDDIFLGLDRPDASEQRLQALGQTLEKILNEHYKTASEGQKAILALLNTIKDGIGALAPKGNEAGDANGLSKEQFEELSNKLDTALKPADDQKQDEDQDALEVTLKGIQIDLKAIIEGLEVKVTNAVLSDSISDKDRRILELERQNQALQESLGKQNFAQEVLEALKKDSVDEEPVAVEDEKDQKIAELEEDNKALLKQIGEANFAQKVLEKLDKPVPPPAISHWVTTPAWLIAVAVAGVIGFQLAKNQNH